jgi:hypothetical protein
LTNLIGVFYEDQKKIFNPMYKCGGIQEIAQNIPNAVEGMVNQCKTYKD